MNNRNETALACTIEELASLIHQRAKNLFETHQLFCSEAVLYVLNLGLGGGLPPEAAIRIASGFSEGIGGAGCACGAFSGGLMALGLFLGRQGFSGKDLRRIQGKGRAFHDLFRSQFGSTCCRILTKKVRDDQRALFRQCAARTGEAAEIAAKLILADRPNLVEQADRDFLSARASTLGACLHRLLGSAHPR